MAHTAIFEITLTSNFSSAVLAHWRSTIFFLFSSTSANASFCKMKRWRFALSKKKSHWYIITYTHKPVNLLLAPLFNPPRPLFIGLNEIYHSTDCSYWPITTLTLHVDWSGMFYSPDSRTGSCNLSKAARPPCVLVIHGELIPVTTPSSS